MLNYDDRYSNGLRVVHLNPEARRRLVASAADLLSCRGLSATSIRELARHAKAPLGSTYHYFPDGKQQVVAEAVQFAGDRVTHSLGKALKAGPIRGLRTFLALWRETIRKSGFRAGCPVLAVSTEEPLGEEGHAALALAAQVFEAWESLLAESLRKHGADKRKAEELATLIIASVEGAVALCRARRSTRPLDQVSRQLEGLIRATIGKTVVAYRRQDHRRRNP